MRYLLLLPSMYTGLAYAGPTTITATGTLASEYVYRGISQSDNHLAPQGSVIISRDGWYGGLWASKADYDDKLTQYELDGFVGKHWQVDKLDLDLHVLKYDYPDTKSAWQYGNWHSYNPASRFSGKRLCYVHPFHFRGLPTQLRGRPGM